jgi:hypothetical protein
MTRLTGVTVTEVLSQRRLNRALLARQHLLERAPLGALEMIEHLGGMQSQAPLAPYVGLWTRLRDFTPDELSAVTEQRQVVRLHLMRNTVHLVSARDALAWRRAFDPLLAAGLAPGFARGVAGVDLPQVVRRAAGLLAQRPHTRAELGRRLAEDWPEADPAALAYAVTHRIALCQVPPRGVWGRGGAATWAPVEQWLGAPLGETTLDALVWRYLGAFGPAGVADVQVWSGLTRLREVVERLPLQTFRSEAGTVLYDRPDAPRPAEDTPAPVRFLPEYDNVLLSHQDRRRVIPEPRPVPLPPGHGATSGTFLIDGFWRGTWRFRDPILRIEPFVKLPDKERDALLSEAERLGAFIAPTGRNVKLMLTPTHNQ